MKKLTMLLIIGLVILASVAFMGCKDVSPEPPVVEPEPVPPTFEETIVGKLWQVEGIEKYQDTRPRSVMDNPYEKDACMLWGDDGFITFWEDANEDGILSPSEQLPGSVPYEITSEVVIVDGMEFAVSYFNSTGWAIEADVTGTTLGDWLGGAGEPYEGWVRIHYVPCMLMWDGNVLEGGFAFVFDDMHDTNAEWVTICKRWWRLNIEYDWADGFYFTSGTPADSYLEDDPALGVHIAIISYHDGKGDDIDTLILIYSEDLGFGVYHAKEALEPMHVYDMLITVDSADVGVFEFLSRVDGSGFDVDVILDRSEMGAFIIRGVDDVDVPVVNPTI